MTAQGSLSALQALFPIASSFDLDEDLVDQRDALERSYAIWVKSDGAKASASEPLCCEETEMRGLFGMTLLERMLHEGLHYCETNEHLDSRTMTLCTGTRHRDGHVPIVYWSPGKQRLRICLVELDLSKEQFCVRTVVA